MGRISHTNFKMCVVIFKIVTSKNHIELRVPGKISDRICDPVPILVKIRLPEFSKAKVFLGDDKGEFSKGTVRWWWVSQTSCCIL